MTILKHNGTPVAYLINQAKLPLFTIAMYRTYDFRDGKLVHVEGDKEIDDFKKKCKDFMDLLSDIDSKLERNKRIAKTVIKKLECEGLILISSIVGNSSAFADSLNAYTELVEFLKERTTVKT